MSFPSLTSEQRSKLAYLDANKSKVIVLVKWRYPFYTNLENLVKAEECALIGAFAEEIREKLFDGYEKHFDEIIWFHADYSNIDEAYSDSESIDVPVIGELAKQITSLIRPSKIRILECEEVLIDVLCRVRAECSILGAKPGDLEPLRNKALLKQTCKTKGIPTAKFVIVDFETTNKTSEQLLDETEREIGIYPMFKKPIKGFGAGGGGELKNRLELKEWLEVMRGKSATYLIEKCIHSREFWTMLVLMQDGSWRILFNLHCGDRTMREAIDGAFPIPFIGQRPEDCEDEFPGLREFVGNVIYKLTPPVPHVFCVQGFQLEPKTDKYLFTECGYRLSGARGCSISYRTCGISQETAFLSTYMYPNYNPQPDQTPFTRAVWYLSHEGTLRSHNKLPENASIKSDVKFNWLVPIGTKLQKATSFNHFVVHVDLVHGDKKTIEVDMQYFLDVWRPDIV